MPYVNVMPEMVDVDDKYRYKKACNSVELQAFLHMYYNLTADHRMVTLSLQNSSTA